MAHQLKMGVIDSIFTLHRRGWSERRIARELGTFGHSAIVELCFAAIPPQLLL